MNIVQPTGDRRTSEPARILVVEDDLIVARDVTSTLEDLGYEVADVVRRGEWVGTAVREHEPDLVLMDIRLAGSVDGVDAAEAVHEDHDLPVVYLTAYADQETLSRASRTTPFGYVVKPFTGRDLQTALEVALLRHRMESQLETERARLAERVKEQSCLYDVSRILHEGNGKLGDRLQRVVERLPAGWQYPELAAARLRLEGDVYRTPEFAPTGRSLTRSVVVDGERVGEVEVRYLEEPPEEEFGPFLEEEAKLLEAVAERVADEVERSRVHRRARRLADIVQSTSDFVGTSTADGRVLWVNEPGRRMVGVPEDETLEGESIFDLSPEWAAEKIRDVGVPAARRDGVWEGETAFLTRGGEEIPVSQVILAHRTGDGEVAYLSTIARDISGPKETERRLRESEGRFRQMAGAIEEVFWLRDPASQEMLYVSPAFEEIWGRPVEDLLEDPRIWLRAIHPEDRERVEETALDERDPQFELEYRIVRPDGDVRWIRDRGFPVTDEEGSLWRVAGVARDVTEEREARRAMEKQRRTLSRILDTAAEGILLTDAEGRFRYANPAAEKILGLEQSEIEGRTYRDPDWEIGDPDGGALPDDRLPVIRVIREGEPVSEVEHSVARPDGSRIVLSVNANPLHDAEGELTGVVVTIRDVTDRKQFEEQLRERALHDYLTGLPNRSLFHDRLVHALDRTRRVGGGLGVLFVDLKRFKVVNDSLGHDAGDRVLEEVARRLRSAVRSQDTVARIGGDEFTILVEDVSDEEEVAEVAERVVGAFDAPVDAGGREIPVEASIGIALHDGGELDDASGSDLVRSADAAMYRAKARPGTEYVFADPDEMKSRPGRLDRETRLRAAIADDEVDTVYQPIYSLATGRISGVEALARWDDPELGPVPPGQFIPLAEETGLIVPLGENQLRTACEQIGPLTGADPDRPVRLHVNLSARQLEDPRVVERIDRILEDTGFSGSRLCLEVTESTALRSPETVERLTGMGLRVAIDDFGTRYSTLSQLRDLRADVLKIDRTFVGGLPDSQRDRALVETIVTLGRTLGLEVVAEGIETEAQYELIRRLECDEAQGFHLARPEGPAVLERLLSEDRPD